MIWAREERLSVDVTLCLPTVCDISIKFVFL